VQSRTHVHKHTHLHVCEAGPAALSRVERLDAAQPDSQHISRQQMRGAGTRWADARVMQCLLSTVNTHTRRPQPHLQRASFSPPSTTRRPPSEPAAAYLRSTPS
jgi:hypothetical protein